jgi:16S rRNA (guanine527-N7)-methyltransferase
MPRSTAGRKSDAPPDLSADRRAALALTPVSRETAARLDRFVALLLEWQRKINLVAPSTLPHLWTRHVADSLQLLTLAPGAKAWLDLGSGSGFPGMAIACALADIPGCRVDLVESNARKAAFLREGARILGLSAVVHCARIEDFMLRAGSEPVDIVTARALAPLPQLLDYAAPALQRGAQGLFPKGQDVEAELTEATKSWSIAVELVPSRTDPKGRIVVVRRADRLGNRT